MKDIKKYVYRLSSNILIFFIECSLFGVVWLNSFNNIKDKAFEGKGNILVMVVYGLLLIGSFKLMRAYQIGVDRVAIVVLSQALALVICNFVCCSVVVLIFGKVDKVISILLIFLFLCALQIILTTFVTWIITNHYTYVFPPHRVLHIYGEYENSLPKKMSSRYEKYLIEESMSYTEPLDVIISEIEKYDAVLLNDIPVVVRNKILKVCYANDKRVYTTPKISDIILRSAIELNLFDSTLYMCRNLGMTIIQRIWKRTFDIVVALLLLVVSSPILLIVSIAIKCEDGGPILFRQLRYTRNKEKFMIIKFRSMIVDAEKEGEVMPAGENDYRITKVGKFIRRTRIDELPQVINILKGEMSFVGPRAERIEHVDKYCKELPEFEFRMKVKAGLTGYAQIYGKYNTSAYDKLKLDMIYILNYSLLMDLQIIFQTLKVILRKSSTQGFDEKQRKEIGR